MPMTLAEYKKQSQDEFRSQVIETFLNHSPFLSRAIIQTIIGGSVTFNREKTLPTGVGWREVNGEFTVSSGEIEQVTESLNIAGGRTKLDRILKQRYGSDRLATELAMQVKATVRLINADIYKGDGLDGAITGLQTRITGDNVIANGTAGLSAASLRAALLRCRGTNKTFFCSESVYSHIWAAYNDGTIQNVTFGAGEFGLTVLSFAGVPIVIAGEDGLGDDVLPYDEGTGTDETSIYLVSFDDTDGTVVIQSDEMNTTPLAEISVLEAYDVEWDMNFMSQTERSAVRISGITDAAMTK